MGKVSEPVDALALCVSWLRANGIDASGRVDEPPNPGDVRVAVRELGGERLDPRSYLHHLGLQLYGHDLTSEDDIFAVGERICGLAQLCHDIMDMVGQAVYSCEVVVMPYPAIDPAIRTARYNMSLDLVVPGNIKEI